MLLFDFKKIERIYSNLVLTDQWKQACNKFKESNIILYYGHGGNLGVADHAAIDTSRLTNFQKTAFSLGSSIQTTSIANDSGYDQLFKEWIKMHTAAFSREKKNKICLIGITATAKSKNFQNALDYIEEQNLSSIYITGKKQEKRSNYHSEIFLDVNSKQDIEVISLALTYEILQECGYDCNQINAI